MFYADYDAENRLKSIEYSDSQNGQHHRLAFSYYYNDFLARVRTYVGQAQVADLRIVRSGYLPLQDRDGSNSVQRSYTWGLNPGGGIGGLLAVTHAGQHYQYLYDGKGNVSAVLDASAQPVASYRYDAFGKLLAKSGGFKQPFMFSTKRYFQGAGLSYYGYRFYQPVMGRWLTRDPLQEAGGINLYGFVQNNPVNAIDPDGRFFFLLAGPAIYTGGMALVDLTIATLMSLTIQNAMNYDDDWRKKVDFDNWDFGKEYWDPPPLDPDEERCKQVKTECFKNCGASELDCPDSKYDQGTKFRNCVSDCLRKNNC